LLFTLCVCFIVVGSSELLLLSSVAFRIFFKYEVLSSQLVDFLLFLVVFLFPLLLQNEADISLSLFWSWKEGWQWKKWEGGLASKEGNGRVMMKKKDEDIRRKYAVVFCVVAVAIVVSSYIVALTALLIGLVPC